MPYHHGITRKHRLGVDQEVPLWVSIGCLIGALLVTACLGLSFMWSII